MDDMTMKSKLKAMSAGDKAAFTDIYNEMKTPVFTVILRIVGSRAEAEDVTQDMFLRLYRQASPENIKNPRAYMLMTARNMALDSLRKKHFEPLDEETEDKTASVDESASLCADIESALGSLDCSERDIVVLHINGGLKFREISQIISVPLGTVLWRYNSAISKLRKKLS